MNFYRAPSSIQCLGAGRVMVVGVGRRGRRLSWEGVGSQACRGFPLVMYIIILHNCFTFNDFGRLQASLYRSSDASFVLLSLKSTEGPISSSSTLGVWLPDFFRIALKTNNSFCYFYLSTTEIYEYFFICRLIFLDLCIILHVVRVLYLQNTSMFIIFYCYK